MTRLRGLAAFEHRVAELAGDGRSQTEIAAFLQVEVSAVVSTIHHLATRLPATVRRAHDARAPLVRVREWVLFCREREQRAAGITDVTSHTRAS